LLGPIRLPYPANLREAWVFHEVRWNDLIVYNGESPDIRSVHCSRDLRSPKTWLHLEYLRPIGENRLEQNVAWACKTMESSHLTCSPLGGPVQFSASRRLSWFDEWNKKHLPSNLACPGTAALPICSDVIDS
jgi:hypothetical protein